MTATNDDLLAELQKITALLTPKAPTGSSVKENGKIIEINGVKVED